MFPQSSHIRIIIYLLALYFLSFFSYRKAPAFYNVHAMLFEVNVSYFSKWNGYKITEKFSVAKCESLSQGEKYASANEQHSIATSSFIVYQWTLSHEDSFSSSRRPTHFTSRRLYRMYRTWVMKQTRTIAASRQAKSAHSKNNFSKLNCA